MFLAGVEAASTGRKQPLKLADKLFPQATGSLCGWGRNCFRRLPNSFGGWCRNCLHRLPVPLWVLQKLFPQAASRLCGVVQKLLPKGGRLREAEPASTGCQQLLQLLQNLLPQLPHNLCGRA